MGNFSRNPRGRLAHSTAEHYVGVRLQQGVPIVDADWNELEDLRRYEFEDVGKWFIGNGVPMGNDGFRIAPIVGDGLNTIVFVSKSTDVLEPSVTVDHTGSTAADVLGFDEHNATSPALLTSNKTEIFIIPNNSRLMIQAENHPAETITFDPAAFTNTTATQITATAAEVAAVINATASRVTAHAGAGKDFIITGGGGTLSDAGRILVDGRIALNEVDIKYTQQPLYQNTALADLWGVAKVDELESSAGDHTYIVYLDIWHREVDSAEDPELIDNRIGVETAIRLKRMWAVRVTREADYPTALAARPDGHVFYRLAQLNRVGNDDRISLGMIRDLRDTQVTVQRRIEIRDSSGTIVVDNDEFRQILENTRDNVFGLIRYITTEFNPMASPMSAAEVLGLQTAEYIARTAETGLGLINSRSLANRGALRFLSQLYHAQNNFMVTWRDAVLLLGGPPRKYEPYASFIDRLNDRLHDQNVGTLTGLLPAIQAEDLESATAMQKEIARLIGAAGSSIPRGNIQVFLSRSPAGNLILNQVARFEFGVRSFTTQADTYTVTILPPAGWTRRVVNASGTPIPNNRIPIGAAGSETTLLVDVTVGAGSSDLQVKVESDANPDEVKQTTGVFALTEGAPAPPGENQFQVDIDEDPPGPGLTFDSDTGVMTATRPANAGEVVPRFFIVRVFNNLSTNATFDLRMDIDNPVGGWGAGFAGGATTSFPVPSEDDASQQAQITPGIDAVSADLRITATTSAAPSVTAQTVIRVEAG